MRRLEVHIQKDGFHNFRNLTNTHSRKLNMHLKMSRHEAIVPLSQLIVPDSSPAVTTAILRDVVLARNSA